MFRGNHPTRVDEKGRLKLPAEFKRRVDELYGEAMRRYARRHLNVRGIVTIAPSEAGKTWSQVEVVCDAALGAGLDRRGVIVGVGGGIALDIAGLAAPAFAVRRASARLRSLEAMRGRVLWEKEDRC